MSINNFKRLQEEEEQLYKERYDARVKSGILQSLSFFRFIGYMMDMYVPKVFDLFVSASGGRQPTAQGKSYNQPPSRPHPTRPTGGRPGAAFDDDDMTNTR